MLYVMLVAQTAGVYSYLCLGDIFYVTLQVNKYVFYLFIKADT